jgi:hypothetical protein
MQVQLFLSRGRDRGFLQASTPMLRMRSKEGSSGGLTTVVSAITALEHLYKTS